MPIFLLFLLLFSNSVNSYVCDDGSTGTNNGAKQMPVGCGDGKYFNCKSAKALADAKKVELDAWYLAKHQSVVAYCEIKGCDPAPLTTVTLTAESPNGCISVYYIRWGGQDSYRYNCGPLFLVECSPDESENFYVETGDTCCPNDCIGDNCSSSGDCPEGQQPKYYRSGDSSSCSASSNITGCYNNSLWPCCRVKGGSYQIPITDYSWTPSTECIDICSGSTCPAGSHSVPENDSDCPFGSKSVGVVSSSESDKVYYKCEYGDYDDSMNPDGVPEGEGGMGEDLPPPNTDEGQTGDEIGDTCDKKGTANYGDGVNDCVDSDSTDGDGAGDGDGPGDGPGECGSMNCESTQKSILRINEGISSGIEDINESVKSIGSDIVDSNNEIKEILTDALSEPPPSDNQYDNTNIFVGDLNISNEYSQRFSKIFGKFSMDLDPPKGSCSGLLDINFTLFERTYNLGLSKYCSYLGMLADAIFIFYTIGLFLWIYGAKS